MSSTEFRTSHLVPRATNNARRPIRLWGVRQNNLKAISVEIPAKKITVVTGLSGSGKSSLAFDTLYAEGQRRYIESLSTYTRQFLEKMPKPDLERIENIPPSIALEQRNHIVNSRSTVGTQTEIVDYLRVAFAKAGRMRCLKCGGAVERVEIETVFHEALKFFAGQRGYIASPVAQSPGSQTKTKTPKNRAKALFEILREQGYSRLLCRVPGKKATKKWLYLDLDEPAETHPATPPDTAIYAVIDRLSVPKAGQSIDADLRARLMDSLGQAISIGRGRLAFVLHDNDRAKELLCGFACRECGTQYTPPEPNLFSFNSPIGACAKCSGFGFTLDLDESLVVPDANKTLKNGAIDPFSKPSLEEWQSEMFRFAERNGISIGKRYRELTPEQRKLLWSGGPGSYPGIVGVFERMAKKKYKLHVRVFIRRYQSQTLCRECDGTRLKKEALAVTVHDRTIADLLNLPVAECAAWFKGQNWSDTPSVKEPIEQIIKRLTLLDAVGVGYLTLSRLGKTLSGGEFQRINLAAQLGNGLCGTLYVLDEPSIGLHAADTEKLIQVLKNLRDQGNTVVVVEHDLEVMRAADWLIELGPGAGRRGGEVIAQGVAADLIAVTGSLTGKYLSGAFTLDRMRSPRTGPSLLEEKKIRITGCRENNLKKISVDIPLDRWTVVTGVSGSGKSTLVHKTIHNALARLFAQQKGEIVSEKSGVFDKLYGAEWLSGVVLLDQKPIGRNSRSNPATYLKAWDEVRRIYANQVLSLRRGFTPQHFSFNVDGGRCPVCKGEGEITVDMHFMAEVKLPCEECGGKRFKRNILEIQYRGKNIDQLLCSTIDEAYDLFRDNPILARKMGILRDVGLGYLQLGQSATTLSGGESQRLKIASVLDEKAARNLLYVFDEPTTGLHLEDIKKLVLVIQDLVDAHNTVLMIEHHLDIIGQADWVIDLGPGGGDNGGNVIAAGTVETLLRTPASVTGQMLLKAGYLPPPAGRDS